MYAECVCACVRRCCVCVRACCICGCVRACSHACVCVFRGGIYSCPGLWNMERISDYPLHYNAHYKAQKLSKFIRRLTYKTLHKMGFGRKPIGEGYRRCSSRPVELLAMQILRGYRIKLQGIEPCCLWTCSSLHKSALGYLLSFKRYLVGMEMMLYACNNRPCIPIPSLSLSP